MFVQHYTKKQDKTGIYLLVEKRITTYKGYKPIIEYKAKVGMSHVGAYNRAKTQTGNREIICPPYKSLPSSILNVLTEIEDIRFFPDITIDQILTIESNCHYVMKEIGTQCGTSEWYDISLAKYSELKKIGLTYIFSKMPIEKLKEIINIAR